MTLLKGCKVITVGPKILVLLEFQYERRRADFDVLHVYFML